MSLNKPLAYHQVITSLSRQIIAQEINNDRNIINYE